MMLVIIALLISILIALVWLYTKRARVLPGIARVSDGYFFLGNVPELKKNRDRFHYYVLEKYAKIGKTFYMSAPMFMPTVILAPNAKTIEYILKDNFFNYVKQPQTVARLRELFGYGIFAVDGGEWRKKRKIASYMFKLRNLKEHMATMFIKHGHIVLERLSNYAETGKTFDLQKLFYAYTFSSFSEIAFGKDPGAIKNDIPFANSFDQVQILMSQRAGDQLWQLKRFLKIGDRERQIVKHMKLINDYAYAEIHNMKNKTDGEKNLDLISRFLVEAKKKGEKLSDEYLRDVLVNFMIAGRDTTASALTWLFFELDQNPDIAEKMTEEVHRVLSDGGLQNLNYDVATKDLKYCKAVIQETLRLHPSVPFDVKMSVNPDTLPDGTKIPSGVGLAYSPWLFGRSTELWGQDALEFRPERWIDNKEPSQYKYISFNAGLRLCLGKPLAYLETTIMVAMILASGFRLSLKSNHDISIDRSILLRLKYGLSMTVNSSKYQASDAPTQFLDPQKGTFFTEEG